MLYYILSLPILIIAVWIATGHIRKRHRHTLFKKDFPADWLNILKQNVPLYRRMPAILQQELLGHIHVFLHEK